MTNRDIMREVRMDASKGCSRGGETQTYFTPYHRHKDRTWGHDLRHIDPETGNDAGMAMDRIEQGLGPIIPPRFK